MTRGRHSGHALAVWSRRAADRGSPRLAQSQYALHPAVVGLVADAGDAAERVEIEPSVRSELAGEPAGAGLLPDQPAAHSPEAAASGA